MGEHLGPWLIRDPEILVAAPVQHDRAASERLPRERGGTATSCRSPARPRPTPPVVHPRRRPATTCSGPHARAPAPRTPPTMSPRSGREAEWRGSACGARRVASGSVQDGVAGEHGGFEPTKLGARLQAQLLDEHVARPLVRRAPPRPGGPPGTAPPSTRPTTAPATGAGPPTTPARPRARRADRASGPRRSDPRRSKGAARRAATPAPRPTRRLDNRPTRRPATARGPRPAPPPRWMRHPSASASRPAVACRSNPVTSMDSGRTQST